MRKKIIILVILVLLLAGGGFYAYQYFTGPEYVVGKALEANNINDVKAYIKENSTDVDKTDQAKRMVKDKAKEIYQNYANDKAKSYDDCEKSLKELAGVEGCKEYTESLQKDLLKMKASKGQFGLGKGQIEKKEYATAFKNLNGVIKQDCNYKTAQKMMNDNYDAYWKKVQEDCAEKVKKNDYSSALNEIDEIKEFGKNKEEIEKYEKGITAKEKAYKKKKKKLHIKRLKHSIKWVKSYVDTSGFTNEFHITYKNVSGKTIKKVEFLFRLYDIYGEEWNGGTPIDFPDNCKSMKNGETRSVYWDLGAGYDKVLPHETCITYKDGSTVTFSTKEMMLLMINQLNKL